jgi:hypothetical protein
VTRGVRAQRTGDDFMDQERGLAGPRAAHEQRVPLRLSQELLRFLLPDSGLKFWLRTLRRLVLASHLRSVVLLPGGSHSCAKRARTVEPRTDRILGSALCAGPATYKSSRNRNVRMRGSCRARPPRPQAYRSSSVNSRHGSTSRAQRRTSQVPKIDQRKDSNRQYQGGQHAPPQPQTYPEDAKQYGNGYR